MLSPPPALPPPVSAERLLIIGLIQGTHLSVLPTRADDFWNAVTHQLVTVLPHRTSFFQASSSCSFPHHLAVRSILELPSCWNTPEGLAGGSGQEAPPVTHLFIFHPPGSMKMPLEPSRLLACHYSLRQQ